MSRSFFLLLAGTQGHAAQTVLCHRSTYRPGSGAACTGPVAPKRRACTAAHDHYANRRPAAACPVFYCAGSTAPGKGARLVGARVVIENRSDRVQTITPRGMLLSDDKDTIYSPIGHTISDTYPSLPAIEILSGERAIGWVFFSVNDGAVPTTLASTDWVTGQVRGSTDFILTLNPSWETIAPPDDLPALKEPGTFNGYSMTVLRVIDPAPAAEISHRLRPGHRIITLEVEMRNESAREALNVIEGSFCLIDEYGFVYQEVFGASTLREFYIDEPVLSMGDEVRGYVSFEVAEEHAPLYVRYAPVWNHDTEGMTVVLKPRD
jgi:hypothetical protein